MTATLVDQAMSQAAQQLAFWVGYNMTIGDNRTVHAVAEVRDSANRPTVAPACGVGWAGSTTRRFRPTTDLVTCSRCSGTGEGVRTPTVAQLALWGPAEDLDAAS